MNRTHNYFRKSTNEWIFVCHGIAENTNYTIKYSHKYKFVAFCKMIINLNNDISKL